MSRADFRVRACFRHAVRQAGIPDEARLLVAVSGGSDSVALLRLSHEEAAARGWSIVVGHVDHGLRPESGDDAGFVRSLAASLGRPCRTVRIPAARWAQQAGSPEAEARRLRRQALRSMARRCGAAWILLGHTRDDQTETVLLRVLRGGGLRGWSGMASVRPPWLRPLLGIPREELRAFLRRGGWSWREDPTNDDLRFLRNRVRFRLLPFLRCEFQPGIDAVLARSADALRAALRFLGEASAAAWREVCLEASPGRIRLDRLRLASYHPAVAEEVLRRAYVRMRGTARDLAQAHLTTLFRLVHSGRGGTWRLPGDLLVVLDRREIRLAHPSQNPDQVRGEDAEPERQPEA